MATADLPSVESSSLLAVSGVAGLPSYTAANTEAADDYNL
jgi:hypothetical protein